MARPKKEKVKEESTEVKPKVGKTKGDPEVILVE